MFVKKSEINKLLDKVFSKTDGTRTKKFLQEQFEGH